MRWLFRRLLCARNGHRIDYFPNDAPNVHRLAFTCACKATWVKREAIEKVVADFWGAA